MKRATSPPRRTTLSERVCQSVRDAIAKGSLAPGARLPSTRVLAVELNVSRNTVVEAYELLALEGLVEAVPGSGTRVCGTPPRRVDLDRILADAHYPAATIPFVDAEGNPLYFRR